MTDCETFPEFQTNHTFVEKIPKRHIVLDIEFINYFTHIQLNSHIIGIGSIFGLHDEELAI